MTWNKTLQANPRFGELPDGPTVPARKVTIKFDTDGAAFEDNWEGGVRHVTNQIKKHLEDASPRGGAARLYDANGNSIGVMEWHKYG